MVTAEIKENGVRVAALVLEPIDYRPGVEGYSGAFQVILAGEKYQAVATLVKIKQKEGE